MYVDIVIASLFDPAIIVIGTLAGGLSRAWWQAILGGLIVSTLVIATMGYYMKLPGVVPIAEGPAGAIWALGIYGLKGLLKKRQERKKSN